MSYKIDEPLNPTERYLYGINIRLDAIIHMMSSFLETYAQKEGIATTNNEVVQEVPQRKTRKKSG